MTDDRWEGFAREDAEYYVLTDVGRHAGREARRAFVESGRADAHRLLERCKPYLDRRVLAIEIGCGVGRVALPVSREFERLIAVDISPTMLAKLRDRAASDPLAGRIEPMLAGDAWDIPDTADLVYSLLVFQHLELFEDIARYVERISQVLRPRAIAYLHFDTRRRTLPYKIRNRLPDAVLSRRWRRGIRRIRRRSESLRTLFAEHGFDICTEHDRDSDHHVFIVRAR